MRPQIVHDHSARGGRIVGGEIGELSLVDRPANRNCGVTLVKAAKDGRPEFVGKSFGAPGDGVTVTLPPDLQLTLSPADIQKIEKHSEERVQRLSFSPADMAAKVNSGRAAIVKRDMDPNVGGGVDRDKLSDADFVDPAHRRFPVVKPGDVSDAVHSFGRQGAPKMGLKQFKQKLTALAHRKGAAFVAQLPDEWTQSSKAAKPGKGKKKSFPGAAEPFKAKDDEPDEEKSEEPDEADGEPAGGKKKPKKSKRPAPPEPDEPDEDDTDDTDDEDDAPKSAKPHVKKGVGSTPKAKGKKKVKPTPKHRTPDGTHDKPPTWDKSAALHDALCPAYRMADVRSVHGLKSVGAAIHTDFVDAGLAELAAALRDLDPGTVKAARRALHKSFTDAYPTAHPTPIDMRPGCFNRTYLSAGHPPASASGAGKQPTGGDFRRVDASSFERGYLSAGHAANSPASKGVDGGAIYRSAAEAQAANAMQALHEHIAVTRPELCPLAHTPVHAVGQGVPTASKTDKTVRKQAKHIKRLEKRLGELASQPDPNAAPLRGILTKNASGGAGPVDRRSLVDEATEREQYLGYLADLTESGDPQLREHARTVLTKLK
jgi:hypothetical protein